MSLPPILKNKLRLPIVASPMFIVSHPDLVIAQCKAGIVGSFPSLSARTAAQFAEWLQRISSELAGHDRSHPDLPAAPFAVNLIVNKANPRLDEDLALCVKHQVPIIITSLGARTDVNEAIHSYGGIVLHDVVNNSFARKAIDKGADGLIAVAAGAGGHAGAQSPFALVQEIRAWFDGPLLLSGAIATGRSVLAAQAIGADLAYVGSAFIATKEANADEAYKRMIVESSAEDIVYTNLFSGVLANYLKPSVRNAGLDPDNLPVSDRSQVNVGGGEMPKAWKTILGSGQGIGAIHDVPSAAELIERIGREYEAAWASLSGVHGGWQSAAKRQAA